MKYLVLGLSMATLMTPFLTAQRVEMQQVAASLGVSCDYCHARDETNRERAAGKKEIARQMIDMMFDLNGKVLTATGKEANQVSQVNCATCHRGVPIPQTMADLMYRSALQDGPDEAIVKYRDLRERFYGRGVYDFGETVLIETGRRLANVNAEAALYLLALNLEFYPESSESYVALAYAYTRDLDDASAMAALRKALDIDPNNAMARGQLQQLESYQRRR